MARVAIAPAQGAVRNGFSPSEKPAGTSNLLGGQRMTSGLHERPMLGATKKSLSTDGAASDLEASFIDDPALVGSARTMQREEVSLGVNTIPSVTAIATEAKQMQADLEKTVRKMPILYVIAFFAVVVGCAVSIIWNTLQVNKLTLERTAIENQIAQTEQRLIKLRAQEMQLSAPTRIRELATTKLGMIEETGENLFVLPHQD